MTKQIEETLGLPSLEDVLGDSAPSPEQEAYLDSIANALAHNDPEMDKQLTDPDGTREHAEEMDEIYGAAMGAHKDALDLAFNMEAKNAGSIMEPAARFLEMAMKAAQNKSDTRLKAIELKMKREKLDNDLKKNQEEGVIEGEAPAQGSLQDRNQLLKRLKEQNK